MESFGSTAVETPRRVEQERIRQTYEYKNSRGEVIARARLEFDAEEVSSGKKPRKEQDGDRFAMAHRLRSFIIEGSAKAGGVQVDLMPVINPHRADILVVEEPLDNYHAARNRVVVPSLKTLLGIGTTLHELGHVAQDHDQAMQTAIDSAEESRHVIFGQGLLKFISSVKSRTEDFLERFPETKSFLKPEDESRLEELRREEEELDRLGIECRNECIELEDQHYQELPRFIAEKLREQGKPTPEELIDACEQTRSNIWIGSLRDEDKKQLPPLIAIAERMGFIFGLAKDLDSIPEDSLFGLPRLPPGWLDGPYALSRLATDFKFSGRSIRSDYRYEQEELFIEQAFAPNQNLEEKFQVQMKIPCSLPEWEEYLKRLTAIDKKTILAKKRLQEHAKKVSEWQQKVQEFIRRSSYYDVLYYPRRKMEVDASRRALEWLRWLRDTHGINLLQIVDVDADSAELMEVVEEVCAGIEEPLHQEKRTRKMPGISIGKDLRRALRTYGAHKLPLGLEKKKPRSKQLPN